MMMAKETIKVEKIDVKEGNVSTQWGVKII